MTTKFDRAYFESRMRRNRELAQRSNEPAIRDIHRQYARFYRELLDTTSDS